MRWIEWQSWGWNAITVSFVATAAFTVFQSWGLWKQDETVRTRQSGASIAVLPFAYIGCVFLAFSYYGIAIGSAAATFNGLLGLLHVRVLASLWRFKRFTRAETILVAGFPLMIVAMIVVPSRGTLLLVLMGGSLVPMAQQPLEMWRARSAGAVDIRYVAIFMTSSAFWTIYALAIGNRVLAIINPSAFAILATTAVLWVRYSDRAQRRL